MFHYKSPEKLIKEIEIKEIKPTREITKFSQLREILTQPEFEKNTHIFFDLNNTLHNFKKTEGMALKEVYGKIGKNYKLKKDELENVYRKIREEQEKEGFIQDKTGFEYRGERFTKLLEHFSIDDEKLVKKLVKIYTEAFERNLVLEKEVLLMLQNLSKKYKLTLVTEGPIDAQRSVIKILGIEEYFPQIFISAKFGQAKETGKLFESAMKELNLNKEEVIIIGDSLIKDIQGANKLGVKSVLVKIY